MALIFTTEELQHIADSLAAFREARGETDLSNAEEQRLESKVMGEISRRDRVADAQAIEPGARAVQYNIGGAITTVYEKPAAAHGVKAPRKGPDGSGVKIEDVDSLLMLIGDVSNLVPED